MSEIKITVKGAAPMDSGASIPRGPLARAGQKFDALLSGWFGPGESLTPQAPAGTQPRTLDYPFGVNMQTTARELAPVPYHLLRQFARQYPLVRAAIEHMKDRICSKPWMIRPKRLPGEKPEAYQKRCEGDPVVAMLTALFERPDLENSWRKWLRKLLSDYFTIDAASISVQRKRNGGIYRLMVVDGATIVRKVDENGMTPMGDDEVAYQQILKGIPAIDLAKRDLLFAADNVEADRLYGYSRVEQIVQWIVLGLNRLVHQSSYYTEGSVPDVFGFLPEGTTPDAAEKWDALFQSILSGNTAKKRKVWWMPWGGHEPVQMKQNDLTDKMDEMLNRFVCFAFGISPSSLVPQVNRAAAGQMADDADEAGETPVSLFVVDTVNELIQSPQYGNLPGYEFAWANTPEVDLLVQAEVDQVYFAMAEESGNGLQILNEYRERDGKPQLEDNTPEPPPQLLPGGGGQDPVDPNVDNTAPGAPPKAKRKALPAPKRAKGTVLTIDPGESTPAKAKAQAAIAGVVLTFLEEQSGPLAKQVGAAYARNKAARAARAKANNGDDDELTDDEIQKIADAVMADVAIDWSGLVDEIKPMLQQAAASGAAQAVTALGASHDIFSQANEWAIEYAQERGAELVGMKYVNGELVENPSAQWAITETTRDKLRDLVVDALENGEPPATLKKAIRESTQFSETRADLVATTETNFANSGGQMQVAKLVGHTNKRSILSGDHDIDDDCDDNASAEDLGILDPFPSGDEFSPFHPGCVCLTQTYNAGKEF